MARPRVLLLDNYDSFTFNVAAALSQAGAVVEVVPSDRLGVAEIRERAPDGLVISPGPCTPNEAGVSLAAIEALGAELPMLGVCLGHQAIAQRFGARVVRARQPVHGQTSPIHHHGEGLFSGLPSPLVGMRYHSLVVERASLPSCLRVTAWTDEGEIMGLEHTSLPLFGLQFHPESFLSEGTLPLFAAFLAQLGSARG
jgi:anthranilate synthase component 2